MKPHNIAVWDIWQVGMSSWKKPVQTKAKELKGGGTGPDLGLPDLVTGWTDFHGRFDKTVQRVRISNLNTCVGLVVAAKKIKGAGFDDVWAYHLAGAGSPTNRKAATHGWGKVLAGVPNTLKGVGDWESPKKGSRSLYVIAVAGPAHPGTPKDFYHDYVTIVKQLWFVKGKTIAGQVLFWLGEEENDLNPKGQPNRGILDVTGDGKASVWHKG